MIIIELAAKRGLTNFDLKLIGITLMVVDHIHEMFAGAGAPDWMDWFGRPVATIFFFLSVEGFTHTHNQKRYLFRLLIGFWTMQIGSQIVQHFFSVGDLGLMNNIFSDIFIGVLTMYGFQLIGTGRTTHHPRQIMIGILMILTPIILSGLMIAFSSAHWLSMGIYVLFPTVLTAENNVFLYIGPLMYLLRKHRNWQLIAIAVFALLATGFSANNLLTTNTEWMRVFAIIPIYFYNGELGKSMKGFFYAFYPLHIWFLYILASLLGVKS
ncbi:TraX family protein [Lentilactobacillus parafarraginis]|uniref:TraX protein n=1 Tax=Lentilactobacillus parafarraginis DSM 18390 = JCM 14109 TaxID=1423786 RepID=A0A0R1YPU6_9LACO|nr:TraX family protein [Lentilactobacillus parafarraginis]KRM44226.1 hypothetical protein FD47_GL000713 [Lentilactobacillus parafarraginis DSM 18390 = JCM 14109]